MPACSFLSGLDFNVEDDPAALRRLCAGHQEAGYSRAKLWVLDGVPGAIERIISAVLNRSEGDFLVPSRIAAELTPTLQQHIGIRPLDTAAMEGLLERNLDGISALHPTALERDGFLLTQLPDILLRRLPIHVRSDGTTGNAENVFREADWPIPEALTLHVLTIRPCNNRQARERQERLIEAWSPRRQIEVALARADPHRFRCEILDALAKLESPPDERSFEALCAKPWLLADKAPVRPQDVLALPPTVDEAARALQPHRFPGALLAGKKRLERNAAVRGQVMMWQHLLVESGKSAAGLFDADNPKPILGIETLPLI